MRKLLVAQTFATFLVLSGAIYAQDQQDVEKTRADILTSKKKIIATTLGLREQEAAVFWPLYEEYQNALRPVHDRSSRLIADYLRDYETLTDEQAKALLRDFLNIERRAAEAERGLCEEVQRCSFPEEGGPVFPAREQDPNSDRL